MNVRTQVRSFTEGQYLLYDVLASVRHAGYTFLVHKIGHEYACTYAPVGLHAGRYASIDLAIAQLKQKADSLIEKGISYAKQTFIDSHTPLLADETGIITEADWHWRESSRFTHGEYLPVPCVADLIYPREHYLHLSVTKTESDFVAYTPNEAYGQADRQVRLKFGKYLRKTFPKLTDSHIQRAVTDLRAKLALAESPATLLFAIDRQTITRIFETQMYSRDSNYVSCMHDKFTGETRPYHVYADSPDVAVAYVLERGEIIARSVVSTKDKVYIRIYSIHENDSTTCQVMASLLVAQGYSEGDLTGNRLTNLGVRCVPYIDCGGMGIIDNGPYWTVCEENKGNYNADQTNGRVTETTPQCERCENDEDDCTCSYCECCEEFYTDGCDTCHMCEECDRCVEHDACTCNRCTDCNRIIELANRYTRCRCERCEDCNELIADCECEPAEEDTDADTDTDTIETKEATA